MLSEWSLFLCRLRAREGRGCGCVWVQLGYNNAASRTGLKLVSTSPSPEYEHTSMPTQRYHTHLCHPHPHLLLVREHAAYPPLYPSLTPPPIQLVRPLQDALAPSREDNIRSRPRNRLRKSRRPRYSRHRRAPGARAAVSGASAPSFTMSTAKADDLGWCRCGRSRWSWRSRTASL